MSKDSINSNQSLQLKIHNNMNYVLNERAIANGAITHIEGKGNQQE